MELGQLAFGISVFDEEVPEIWHAAIQHIMNHYETYHWNRNQDEFDYYMDVDCNEVPFQYFPYSWSDDQQEYNFRWKDVKIRFYKRLGRSMTSNTKLTPELANEMLEDVIPKMDDLINSDLY